MDKYAKRFSVPNEIMTLKLSPEALAVYNYLLYCEDRKTFQCHPSYKTIGKALSMSRNTVMKYVRELEDKLLISKEPTKVILKNGKVRNGNLVYTIEPIYKAMDYYNQEQLCRADRQHGITRAQKKLEAYDRKHPRTTA